MKRIPKIVNSPHYHIWTDALHARQLAYQAKNKWDRGTYVRWTITSAWTALEMACEDALQETGIGRRFKDNLNTAISSKGIDAIDWSQGIWQKISIIHRTRKELVHVNQSQENLFLETLVADHAIQHTREAVKDIYLKSGSIVPSWVEDDFDQGWDKGSGSMFQSMMSKDGADPSSPSSIVVGYVYKGTEHICEAWPEGTNPDSLIENLLEKLNVPVTRVFVRRGNVILIDQEMTMRGGT
jgi:hypothetical protein